MSAMTKLSEVWGTKKGKGIKTLQISELRQICRTSEYNNKVRCVKNSKTTNMVWPTIKLHGCKILY